MLVGYSLAPIAYQEGRPTSAEEYKMLLTASVLLTRRGSGEVVVETPRVSGEATFTLTGDLTSSKNDFPAQDRGKSRTAHRRQPG